MLKYSFQVDGFHFSIQKLENINKKKSMNEYILIVIIICKKKL